MLRRNLIGIPVSWLAGLRAEAAGSIIQRVELVRWKTDKAAADHPEIEAGGGRIGVFGPLGWGLPKLLAEDLARLREQLLGKDALDRRIEFESLWKSFYPGKELSAYAGGVDPLTGQSIEGTTRGGRHSPTGLRIMALSAVDHALWDLRGKIIGRPVYRITGGTQNRRRLDVYSRVGEGKDLGEARRQARERWEKGQKKQKWYFVFGPKDGKEGLKANLELVRVLKEELPEATFMFDNHSMRFEIGVDWVVELGKQMAQYKPFWLEEPTAPEDTEGYARIKGETGLTIAAGEHHYTRHQIQRLLERKCLDWVQSDPDWCGGISEWLRIAEMAGKHRGVRVVPHCDNFMTNVQCVASQPVSLCPMVEYNDTQTEQKMSYRTRVLRPANEVIDTPAEPGLGPDLDRAKLERV